MHMISFLFAVGRYPNTVPAFPSGARLGGGHVSRFTSLLADVAMCQYFISLILQAYCATRI
jgi:hypothetical protein